MTKNFRSCVYTSCVKFNKVCQPYPQINTGGCTKGSLRGVDKPDGLDYKQSQTGWKTCSVRKQLAEDNTRPMGLASHIRVSPRVDSGTLAVKDNARDNVLAGGAGKDLGRDQRALVQGCNCGGNNFQGKLCITNLSSGKEGGGSKTCNKSKIPEQLCEDRALQNGGVAQPPRPHPTRRLDDKIRFERCLPSGTNPPGMPSPPSVPMEQPNLPVSVSSLWVDIGPTCVFESDETCSGDPEAHGHPSHHIPGRHLDLTPGKGGAYPAHSADLPVSRGSGLSSQPEEVIVNPTAKNGIFGVSGRCKHSASDISSRETQENSTTSSASPSPTDCLSERPGKICGENFSIPEGDMASPTALQGITVSDPLCNSRGPLPVRLYGDEIQCQFTTYRRGREQPNMVDCPRQKNPNAISVDTPSTQYDHRVRCLQHGMGCSTGRTAHRGEVVPGGSLTPHKLPGVTGCLSGTTVFCQAQSGHNHSDEAGQCHSSDIYQQARGDTLPSTLPVGSSNMGMVYSEKYLPASRALAREGQFSSGSGIKIDEGSLRLDAKSPGVQSDPTPDGSLTNRFVCFPINEATSSILQLEARPGSTGDRCIQSGLVPDEGLCQPTLVLNSTLPESSKETGSQSGDNHPSMAITTMVPINPGNAGGLPQTFTGEGRSGDAPDRAKLHNEPRGASVSCMAHIWESFDSRGISPEASNLLLASWRPKTKSNYNSLFAKWAGWCAQRNRDPINGPVEDIINFLAELFKDGYQYRSLNSYRSAISAIHSKVDGQSIGQHPLVTRMLKGAFNERPPLARYSTFWDVGIVLNYLRDLGANETLSLRLLTLKSVMLLALTRPARSVDLSKLDIRARSFTAAGVTFKALHLSKQSKASKPLVDFFYPRFPEEEVICPVATLQAYEARTLRFRALSTDKAKTLVFLSWIGEHEPVTSSTIARWLRTCLSEAGIDTGIFKAHSVRGAASSKAAAVGVTTADILQAADWSSVSTFQKFYLRSTQESKNHPPFGKAVLASVGASNLHVDMETEPSEM